MTLGELFSGITEIPVALRNTQVTGVTSDNREVQPGFLFVCVKGRSFDGHDVAAEMLEKGACAVMTERALGLPAEINVSGSSNLTMPPADLLLHSSSNITAWRLSSFSI